MVSGVRRYFDRGLRHFLLYSHEVAQAEEAGILGEGAGSGGSRDAPGASTPPKQGARGVGAAGGWGVEGCCGDVCRMRGYEPAPELFGPLPAGACRGRQQQRLQEGLR